MERYAAAGSLAANGAEIVAVEDPAGARLDAALRCVMLAARDDPGPWDDIIQPARLLRWHLATRLQADPGQDIVAEIEKQERRLRSAVTDGSLLTILASAARAAAEAESPLADALLDMISRIGRESCVIVAASRPAQAALAGFGDTAGVRVLTAAELARQETCTGYAYAVGPPRFFGAPLVTAPAARSVSFVLPSWVRDRTLPSSPVTAYADSGAMLIRSSTRTVGTGSPADTEVTASGMETAEKASPQPTPANFSTTCSRSQPGMNWQRRHARREVTRSSRTRSSSTAARRSGSTITMGSASGPLTRLLRMGNGYSTRNCRQCGLALTSCSGGEYPVMAP